MTDKEIPISLNPGKLLIMFLTVNLCRVLAVQETCFEQYDEPSNNHTYLHVWLQYHNLPIPALRRPRNSVLL